MASDEGLARLLGAALAGGAAALEEVYRRMAADLWAFALWRSGDPEIASDAVQTVFCRIAGARSGGGGFDRRAPGASPPSAAR